MAFSQFKQPEPHCTRVVSAAKGDENGEPSRPDHRRRASGVDDAGSVTQAPWLSRGYRGHSVAGAQTAEIKFALARIAGSTTAGRPRLGNARSDQDGVARSAGDHSDSARLIA